MIGHCTGAATASATLSPIPGTNVGREMNLPPVPSNAARPDATLTPGDKLAIHTTRNVPFRLKIAVYKSYGIPVLKRIRYTIDHLIPLELDGTNSQRNLWPQPKKEAKIKDVWENEYAAAVKGLAVTLDVAVEAILANWGPK